ncbi:PKD domain-containing protein, partial [Chitinophaga sp.]|uniref:PKD domain-containing protein n=1 Tax=Chitinophaga sp. TaxID=1869181 RepID=UPI002C4D25EB
DGGKNGIKIFAYQTPIGHQVYNNLLVQTGTAYDYPSKGMYIKGDQPIKLTAGNNICYTDVASANFVDGAGGNYRLQSTSTAVNTGRDMTDFALKTDFDNAPRPQQSKYDVGAFEFKSGSTTLPPVSNAGSNITITLPVDNVTLDGALSTASAGSTIQSYAWKKISGPSAGTIVSPAVVKTNVTGLTEGAYVYALTVTDKNGLTDADSITVTVKAAANKPPVASAGSDVQVQLPVNTASLDGSASTDADGQISAWAWSKTAGPAGGDLSAPNAAKTNVTNLVAGAYTFRLIITDNAGAKDTATVKVTVLAAANKPPVASAGKNIQVQLPVNTATLNGSSSTDADGQIVSWLWQKTTGPAGGDLATAGAAQSAVNNLAAGTYTYQLTVTDNNNATATATVSILVLAAAPNQSPVADAGNNIAIQLPVSSAALDGSASADADGQIVTWLWEKTAGPAGGNIASAGTAKTNVTNLQEGTYTFRLTVTDNNGATSKATVSVVVTAAPVNQPPVAVAGNNITVQLPVSSAALDGSASSDADGRIETWLWEKSAGPAGGDIASAGAAKTNITNLQTGTYTFRLTVKDNNGATASATVSITVLPVPNKAPVAQTQGDKSIQQPMNSFIADGSASYDPDGTIVKYEWTQVTGPTRANFKSPGQVQTLINGLQAGEYQFRLTVTDDGDATATTTFNLTVLGNDIISHGDDSLAISPNPATDHIRLRIARKGTLPLHVRIYDMNGRIQQQLMFTTPDSFQSDVNISNLSNGHFIVEVKSQDNSFNKKGRFIKISN